MLSTRERQSVQLSLTHRNSIVQTHAYASNVMSRGYFKGSKSYKTEKVTNNGPNKWNNYYNRVMLFPPGYKISGGKITNLPVTKAKTLK